MKLPRFVVRRAHKNNEVYYWQVPKHSRVVTNGTEWPAGLIRLPLEADERERRAASLNAELDLLRAGATADTREGTLPWLIAQYEHTDRFKKRAPKTQRSYQEMARHLLKWSEQKNHPPVAAMTTPKILQFLATYDHCPSLRNHIASYLRLTMAYARRIGQVTTNPAVDLGLEGAKRRKPIVTIDLPGVLQIVAKADEMDRPWVGTAVLLHFDLGQRQGDILRLQKPRDYKDGVFQFAQSKTAQIVTIKPFLDETIARLNALPTTQLMLVGGRNGLAIKPRAYSGDFRAIADACGFKDLWEMELRHSAVVYMERAGMTPGEISTRTGHTLKNVYTILESYRTRDPVVAEQGANKLIAYRKRTNSA